MEKIKQGFLRPYHTNGEKKTRKEQDREEIILTVSIFLLFISGLILFSVILLRL